MSAVTIVFNPESGSSVGQDELQAAFQPYESSHTITWSPTTEDDPGFGQTRAAVERGDDTVIAVGGDGTVRAVAECLAGTDTTLGVVPLGTGNLLAGNLGVPEGLDAVAASLSSATRTLDVGVVNDERFTVMAGMGFDACMIRDANPEVKRKLGTVAYVISGAKNAPASLVGATVSIDGRQVWRGRTAMVLVGNCGSVTGGLEVFPDARTDDGRLDVAVLTAERPRDWLKVMWSLARHQPQSADLVQRFTGAAIEVHLDRPMPYELDGEDRDPSAQLSFSVEPASLQVRAS